MPLKSPKPSMPKIWFGKKTDGGLKTMSTLRPTAQISRQPGGRPRRPHRPISLYQPGLSGRSHPQLSRPLRHHARRIRPPAPNGRTNAAPQGPQQSPRPPLTRADVAAHLETMLYRGVNRDTIITEGLRLLQALPQTGAIHCAHDWLRGAAHFHAWTKARHIAYAISSLK